MPMLMAGFMLGFLSSYITNLIPKEIINKTVVGIFLTIEGLGAILGGLLSGILCDFFTITKVGQSCFATICCNLVLIYACVESQPTTLLLPYLCALVWGFADNYL